jgi:DMSO/TMAO reductase YedYZ heme-binding membrane subunit
MKPLPEKFIRALKAPVFLLCLGPAFVLTWKGFHDGLGANPIDVITRTTGRWTLTFLLITLSVTPVRKLQLDLAHPLPPHAGTVRILLRVIAFNDLRLARQIF